MTLDYSPLGPAILFCPADRPDRYDKAAAAADAVILDLEDAVAPADKPAARQALVASRLDPARTIVRVNSAASEEFALDLAALRETAYRYVMLAKAEHPEHVALLDGYQVIALCESPLGVRNAELLAESPQVIGLMWGAEDLVAGLGGSSSRLDTGGYRDVAMYARSRVLIAAVAADVFAWDAVHLDIQDVDGQRAEATDAAASGFAATVCIHPTQVGIVRDAYLPTAEALAWADGVLAAAVSQGGVFRHEGRMVDEPVLKQARQVISRARGALDESAPAQ